MSTVFNIDALKARIRLMNPIDEAEAIRSIYKEELMDWIDCYHETLQPRVTSVVLESDKAQTDPEAQDEMASSNAMSDEAIQAQTSIVQLWIEYATFEKNLHQFKKAVQVYEDAINEQVSGSSCDIYIAYAKYFKERDKSSSAKKQIIRGLCTKSMSMKDSDRLWLYFLKYMHEENKSVALSIDAIFDAVRTQLADVGSTLIPPSKEFHIKYGPRGELVSEQPQNIAKTGEIAVGSINTHIKATTSKESTAKSDTTSSSLDVNAMTDISTFKRINDAPMPKLDQAESKESEAVSVPITIAVPSITDITMAAMGAPSQYTAPMGIAPMGIADMDSSIDDLEDWSDLSPEVIIRVHSERPPILLSAHDKEPMSWGLSSISSTDIAEIEAFWGCPIAAINNEPSKANYILDILEAMWIYQALKERDFDSWFTSLKKKHSEEEAVAQQTLDIANISGIQDLIKKKEEELQRVKDRILVQRELLHAIVNRIFHKLLLQQQRLLYQIGFPGFSVEVIRMLDDAINQAVSNPSIHSPYSHVPKLLDQVAHQSVLVCSCLSLRLHSLKFDDVQSPMNASINPNDMMSNDVNLNALSGTPMRRMSSLESDRSGDWSQNNRRKRRRRVKMVGNDIDGVSDGYSMDYSQYNPIQKQRGSGLAKMQLAYESASFHPVNPISSGPVFPMITVPDVSTISQLGSMPMDASTSYGQH